MPNYIHKPLSVFAMQYTGDNAEEIQKKFSKINIKNIDPRWYSIHSKHLLVMVSLFLNINYRLYVGNYILRDHNGEISVMGEEKFNEKYIISEEK